MQLKCGVASFAGPDPNGLRDVGDEDFAVADFAGLGGCLDRFQCGFDLVVRDNEFQL